MKGCPVPSIILLLTFQAFCPSGLLLQGEFPHGSDLTEYLGKFCFYYSPSGEKVGIIHFELKPKTYNLPKSITDHMELSLLIFDDQEDHWQRARRDWNSLSCAEKKALASMVTKVNISHITTSQPIDYQINIVERLRPRFWYFTLVACDVPNQLPTATHGVWEHPLSQLSMDYKLHAENLALGWQSEFSWDQADMLRVYMAFCACFVCVWGYCIFESSKKGIRQHPLVRMLSLANALSVATTLIFAVYYGIFSQHGSQCGWLRFVGLLVGTIVIAAIFLVIMMVGEGWAEVKGFACSLKDKLQFFQAVVVLAGACAFCEIHDQFVVDQSTKLYTYQSVPGVLALLIKIVMFSWFWRSTQKTLSSTQGQQDQAFYKILLWSITGWFLSVPVTVMMAWFINPWHRYKLITIIDLVSRLAGQGLLSFLLCGHLSPLCKLEIAISSSKSDATGYELMDHNIGLAPATGP